MNSVIYIDSPIGPLTLGEVDGALSYLLFGHARIKGYEERKSHLLERVCTELFEYFGKKRREFSIPLNPMGTEFQLRVWGMLKEIPYGEIITYRTLAQRSGCPKGYRAVGMANHRNPISIIIPCHRVVGADGSLTGYGGGLEAKRWLLNLEGIHYQHGKVIS